MIIKYTGDFVSRFVLLFGPAMLWYKHERVNVDYSKYLGPDWKLTFDKPSTIIGNHSSWIVSHRLQDFRVIINKVVSYF